MEGQVAEIKVDSETLNKVFKSESKSKDGINLVIEEHIKTEQLDDDDSSKKLVKQTSEEMSSLVTCGTLIIRKQGSKEADDMADVIEGENANEYLETKIENIDDHDLQDTTQENKIKQSYDLLQELFDSKMAAVSPAVKDKSVSPFRIKKKSMIIEDVKPEASHSNLSPDFQPKQTFDDSENTEGEFETGAINDFLTDFSVSVLKFQDAIESFSDAIFNNDMEDGSQDNEEVDNTKSNADASIHHRFKELKGNEGGYSQTSGEAITERIEVVEEPIVEQFVSKLESDQEVIESILNSIEPTKEVVEEDIIVVEQPLVEHFVSKLQSDQEVIESIVKNIDPKVEEETITFETKNAEGDGFIQQSAMLSNELDNRIDDLASQILKESKAEITLKKNEVQTLTKSQQNIPEICITADDNDDVMSPKPDESKTTEPSWVSIPIIRGKSMQENKENTISIQELSDSDVIEESSQQSPIISDDTESSRKISEPVKSTFHIEEISTTDGFETTESNEDDCQVLDKAMENVQEANNESSPPPVHIAFSRNIEDVKEEEADIFIPLTHQSSISNMKNTVHNYEQVKSSQEETLSYDEQLKDITEYNTNSLVSNMKNENNVKECATSIMLNEDNSSSNNVLTSSTNIIEAENIEVESKESSTHIQKLCTDIPTSINSTCSDKKELEVKHKCENEDIGSNEIFASTIQSSQVDETIDPPISWMKAFALIMAGAVLLTCYWMPSESNTVCQAMHDHEGKKFTACATDGYIGLSHMNYEEI